MLNRLKDLELHESFIQTAKKERAITNEVLMHILEVDRRRLHLSMAYPSLFEYMVKGLGYSESSAMRRIHAARAMRETPRLGEKLEDGSLSLTQVTKVQMAVRQIQKEGVVVSREQKQNLFQTLEGKSGKETDQILAKELNFKPQVQEKARIQQDSSTRLEITLSHEQMQILETAKNELGFAVPNGSWAEVITYLAQQQLKKSKRRPEEMQKNSREPVTREPVTAEKITTATAVRVQAGAKASGMIREPAESQAAQEISTAMNVKKSLRHAEPARKYISIQTRREIFQRDKVCLYKNNGKICASSRHLTIDHIQPIWAGGGDEPSNLRVLCGQHNQHRYRVGR